MPTRNEGINRPSWKHKRPAPRTAAAGTFDKSKLMKQDDVDWSRIIDPPERYRILYQDRHGKRTERVIELRKIGIYDGSPYYGVMHLGQPKTFRCDRVIAVLEQLTEGHECSIEPAPDYSTQLPKFPVANAQYKVPQTARPDRNWSVDLNLYTCSCPEQRIRREFGYGPGDLGFTCSHMARAILDHLPAEANWPPALLLFLRNPRRIHIDNLT